MKTIEWERQAISSRKLEIPREIFMQTWVQKKERNVTDLTEAEDIKKRWHGYIEELLKKKKKKKIFLTQITTML